MFLLRPVYKTFFMLNTAEHEICPANKSQITNNCKLVGIFIFISRENFMLNWVEHEKISITSGLSASNE